MGLHKSFFEGQSPPKLAIESQENLEWYQEQIDRCWYGHTYRGTRITGNHYWMMNFCPIMRVVTDKAGNATKDFETDFPLFSQEDDYLFKQIEEARQDDKDFFLFTGRGFGKTYLVISIENKYYYLKPESHCVTSASGEDHANETWSKLETMIRATSAVHPTIAQQFLINNEKIMKSGLSVTIDGVEKIIGNQSVQEKIVYDKKPGKSKGRRLDVQHFEEAGDWSGPANLIDCIGASEGTWKVGGIRRAQVFYTGTGGVITAPEAKIIFNNPDAFNLYPVETWGRKTGIVVPSYKKYGGTWERTGISDEVEAKKQLDELREKKKSDKRSYDIFIREYPYTPDELFTMSGTNNFDQDKIAHQLTLIENSKEHQLGERGFLHWKTKNHKPVGVEWEKNPNGDIWILEHPSKREDGIVWPNLYVGGYDGIDLGADDSFTGIGSDGALSIKKRMRTMTESNNVYVCFYVGRPPDISDHYDNVLKISWYYNCKINIEYTKIGIVGHFKPRKEMHRFMRRPKLTLTNPDQELDSKLIGTTATNKNFEHGENFLINYVRDYCDQLFYVPALNQLKDFTMERRGDFDIIVSMMMTELADDELMGTTIEPPPKTFEIQNYGYYTDRNGVKRFGKIPGNTQTEFNFNNNTLLPDFANRAG